jgi:hypothetical protein
MNERRRRIGENEAIFRSVNEQVKALNATLSTTTNTIRVVCECGTRSCTDQIEIRPDAYEAVRADSTLFITKPGHDFPETEQVISKSDRHWVVRKDPGLPTRIARATDPNR